mmetsp:Transcript_24476/g.79045  ORF Transcript_24476/g.79045 Transcript_24476/m.79045 type:complete len:201 (+) Transcript_24476:768-1370(+)
MAQTRKTSSSQRGLATTAWSVRSGHLRCQPPLDDDDRRAGRRTAWKAGTEAPRATRGQGVEPTFSTGMVWVHRNVDSHRLRGTVRWSARNAPAPTAAPSVCDCVRTRPFRWHVTKRAAPKATSDGLEGFSSSSSAAVERSAGHSKRHWASPLPKSKGSSGTSKESSPRTFVVVTAPQGEGPGATKASAQTTTPKTTSNEA